jgi:carbon starvation protein
MLAAMALSFACVCLVKMKRERYLWIPLLPTVWLVICTLTAGWMKLFSPDLRIGFLAHAQSFRDGIAQGTVMAPAKSLEDMQRVIQNDYVNSAMTVALMSLVVALVCLAARAALRARRSPIVTAQETPYVAA